MDPGFGIAPGLNPDTTPQSSVRVRYGSYPDYNLVHSPIHILFTSKIPWIWTLVAHPLVVWMMHYDPV